MYTFRDYFEDYPEELEQLLEIPYRFHRQRRQLFQVFTEYSLNLCKLMNVKKANTNAANAKSKSLATIAAKPVYDFMTLEEETIVPKYLTIIKEGKHMWDTSIQFNPNGNAEARSLYIASLQNLLSIPYVITNEGPRVMSPYGDGADLTSAYQIATLLGRMLIKDPAPASNKMADNIMTKYGYFESYYKMVCQQDSCIRGLIHNPTYPKIDMISIIKYYKELSNREDKVKMLKPLQVFIALFYILFYVYYPPIYHSCNQALKHYDYYQDEEVIQDIINLNITEKNVNNIEKRVIATYSKTLLDYMQAMCYEGMGEATSTLYNFTELSKEYYLLCHLKSKFPSELPSDEGALTRMIAALNETFAYYKPKENQTTSKARAIEYLIKVRLIDEHKTRLYGALLPFEKMLAYILTQTGNDAIKSMFTMSGTTTLVDGFLNKARVLITGAEGNIDAFYEALFNAITF